MKITEYVPANEIWPGAKSYIDHGYKSGLVRGYNVEVVTKDGRTEWFACEFIHGEPEHELFDEAHMFHYAYSNCKPTGRVSFRGYGKEEYSWEEHDTYVVPMEV